VFWKAGGGVSSSSVTGGTALAITTSVGNAITLIQATVSNSGTLGLPTGFYTATVLPTSAMNSFATAGSNVSHGWPKCQISGGAGFFGYEDGSGHNWDGGGNVFAIAALPYTPPIPPVIPPPTITGYSYSITLQFIDPVVMEDVWGYEIRASDNTVLYHSDLVDSQYTGQVTLSTDSRSVLYYLYSYNLLGEYSSTPNTASFSSTAPSTISNLRVDDPTQTLLWDFSGTLFSGSSYSVLVDTTGTFTSPTVQATTTTTSYPIPTSEFFADRFFRVTYPDPLGPSVPQTIEHTYAPAGVSGFGSGQAFPVEPPPTGSSSPVTPTGLPAAYVSLYDSLSLAVQ
jgi:hypothetical protein